jgi:hypothetical protein
LNILGTRNCRTKKKGLSIIVYAEQLKGYTYVSSKIETLIIHEIFKNNYFSKKKEKVHNRIRKTQQQLENYRHNQQIQLDDHNSLPFSISFPLMQILQTCTRAEHVYKNLEKKKGERI